MRGSIRKRGASSWWIVFNVATGEPGKRKQRTVTMKGSYRDAQKELTKLISAADAGSLPEPSRETVATYMTAWLHASTAQSPKTKERYAGLVRLQIVPHLGAIPLQKLRPSHIAAWHATLIGNGLSAQTVLHAHRVLSLALKQAVEHGTLTRNPALAARPPRVEGREIEILPQAQIATLMAGLADHPLLYPVAVLALASGMRRGELLALEWGDVDLDRGVVRVERSVEETKAGGLRVKAPKTKRGRRNIGLTADAVAVLREHRKRQLELRLQLGFGGQPVLVFSTLDGDILSPDNFSRDWRRTLRARKLPLCSFHALRHTHASLLLAGGTDVLTVSRRLGHAKASVTLDTYGHKVEGGDQAATKTIERMLK